MNFPRLPARKILKTKPQNPMRWSVKRMEKIENVIIIN